MTYEKIVLIDIKPMFFLFFFFIFASIRTSLRTPQLISWDNLPDSTTFGCQKKIHRILLGS